MDINIRDINISRLNIPDVPKYLTDPPQALPIAVPVTQQIGVPIVDVPGCVEAHEQQDGKNQNITGDDPRGVKTYCDGGYPSFNPLNYEPEQIVPTFPAGVDTRTQEPKEQIPESAPIPNTPANTIKCKPDEKLNLELNICEKIEEVIEEISEIPWQEKYLPAPEAATTTAAIAVVATTSALLAKPLADLLLKAVKPTVKKVMKKVSQIRRKPIPVKSSGERRAEQRQMNHAVRALRSVFPRKKKRKG